MTADLRPYPEYKESGLPWLGRIPAHWKVLRCKYLFREVDERSKTGEETHLSMSQTHGLIPSSDLDGRRLHSESYAGGKLCQTNDLVLNRLKAHLGVFAHARQTGVVSPDYTVLRPLNGDDVLFFEYVFKTPTCIAELRRSTKGIVEGFWRLYTDDFYNIRVCVPPIEERSVIIKFIKTLDQKVHRFIHNRRRLIKALSEHTATYARNAVEVEDVTSSRLGLLADQVLRPVYRVPNDEYVPIGLYNRGRGMFHKQVTQGSDLGDSDFYWIEEGDLIISGQFAWEGAVALAGEEDSGCIASHRYPVLRGKQGLAESAYLLAFFNTPYGRLLLDCNSRGAAGRNRPLNLRMLMKEKIPTPPLSVQVKIAEMLLSGMKLKRIVSKEIAVILEYRNRLVTDVVTGKADVQHFCPDIEDNVDDFLDHEEDMDIGDMMMDEELEGISDIDDSKGN